MRARAEVVFAGFLLLLAIMVVSFPAYALVAQLTGRSGIWLYVLVVWFETCGVAVVWWALEAVFGP